MVPQCCLAHEADIRPGGVDIVMVWVALHDMNNPTTVLETARSLLAPDGCVLVLEFTNPDNFTDLVNGATEEAKKLRPQTQFCLSVSVLHCLPVSKTIAPSQAIGTSISLSTIQKIASRAGFTNVSVFPANETMSMYVLRKQ